MPDEQSRILCRLLTVLNFAKALNVSGSILEISFYGNVNPVDIPDRQCAEPVGFFAACEDKITALEKELEGIYSSLARLKADCVKDR